MLEISENQHLYFTSMKIESLTSSFTIPLLFSLLMLASQASFLKAEEAEPTTSIKGQVVLPKNIPAGINTAGLSLKDAIVRLEGKANFLKKPFPSNWQEMTTDERQTWSNNFDNSEAGTAHKKGVEQALAKRPIQSTTLNEDGAFTFENVNPSWYSLTIQIMPPNVAEQPDFSSTQAFAVHQSARASALHQFFVKTTEKPHQLGTLTLRVKNVVTVGNQAPDFTATDFEGDSFKLSDYRGKYVLFDFWATWCVPCIAQFPHLEAVSKEFGGEHFEIIGLNVDEKFEDAKSLLQKKRSSYRQAYLGSEQIYAPIRMAYGIESIPSIWLIDPEGKVVARDLMGPSIKEAVAKYLDAQTKAPIR